MRASGKRCASAVTATHFVVAAQDAALELEILEAVARLRRFREADDGRWRQRLLVAQPEPVVLRAGLRWR